MKLIIEHSTQQLRLFINASAFLLLTLVFSSTSYTKESGVKKISDEKYENTPNQQIEKNQTENSKNKNPFPVRYVSEIDQKLTIKTLTLAPVYDNVNGIYSEPIEKLLIELLQADKMWGYTEFPKTDKKIFVETYESKPNDVLNILNQTKTQGLLVALITKGPRGLSAKLKLFSQEQGLLLIEEEFNDVTTFEVEKVRNEFIKLYAQLKNKLPYTGWVLSRQALDVTLNVGELNGVTVGQEIALAQIIKLNRHPKLKTMISVEKEIIGKIKITKVEPYLSFGQIILEKETGVIEVGVKILPLDFIKYPTPQIDEQGRFTGDKK